MGDVYLAKDDYPMARDYFTRTLNYAKRHADIDPSLVIHALEGIAQADLYADNFDAAGAGFHKALDAQLAYAGEMTPRTAELLNELGSLEYMRGRLDAAADYFERTAAIERRVLGERHPEYAVTVNNLARVYLERRKFTKARDLLQQSLAARSSQTVETDDQLAFVLSNLALANMGLGDYHEAEPLFERALKIAILNKHRLHGPILTDLADLECRTGRQPAGPEAARGSAPYCRRALSGRSVADGAHRQRRGRLPDGARAIRESRAAAQLECGRTRAEMEARLALWVRCARAEPAPCQRDQEKDMSSESSVYEIPYFIGVVGHRDLVPAQLPAIHAAVVELLSRITARYAAARPTLLVPWRKAQTSLWPRPPLSSGCRFSRSFPTRKSFAAADLKSDASRALFDRLCAKAESRELSLPAGAAPADLEHPGMLRDRQFQRAGAIIARYSALLITIWDGLDTTHRAGTARVVESRRKGLVPTDDTVLLPRDALLSAQDNDLMFEIRCSRSKSQPENGRGANESGVVVRGLVGNGVACRRCVAVRVDGAARALLGIQSRRR